MTIVNFKLRFVANKQIMNCLLTVFYGCCSLNALGADANIRGLTTLDGGTSIGQTSSTTGQSSGSSEPSCTSEVDDALRRACRDGEQLACGSLSEIEKNSELMNLAIKRQITSYGSKQSVTNESGQTKVYYFFKAADVQTLQRQWVSQLASVRNFPLTIETDLRDLMDEKFDGASFSHDYCYDRRTFPDDCDRKIEDEYDDKCEDGEDIIEELVSYADVKGVDQAQIVWDESLQNIRANSTWNNATGIWISEDKIDSMLQENRTLWGPDYKSIITSYRQLAERTFNREFNDCPRGWGAAIALFVAGLTPP